MTCCTRRGIRRVRSVIGMKRRCFAADTLFYQGYGRVDLAGGNSLQMALSLKRLLKLPGDTVCYPGHGMKTKIAWEQEANA
ncbi:MAG: hypothetical protein ACLUHE_16815 [Christensenellales bacterium]